jgi:hypothetical protein
MLLALGLAAPVLASDEDSAVESGTGNEVVRNAAQTINKQPAFEVKVRQRATMFGQRVSGAGFYLQLPDTDRILLRYEFQLKVGEQLTSLLQVNDGTTLWIRQNFGQLHSQAYVNVRKLREAKQQQLSETSSAGEFAPNLAVGGLSSILLNIEQSFQFDEPQQSELFNIPTWEISGTWKPERLAQIARDEGSLPSHLPDTVKLVLRRDDEFPLLPYRVQFGRTQRRDSVASIASGKIAVVHPLVTIDLSEPRRRPDLRPADFAFQPSDENVEDRTDVYLRKLGLVKTE